MIRLRPNDLRVESFSIDSPKLLATTGNPSGFLTCVPCNGNTLNCESVEQCPPFTPGCESVEVCYTDDCLSTGC
jgi:hypothetical protein